MLTKERLRHLEGVVRRALSAPGAIVGAGVLSQEAVRAISREMDGIRLLAPPSVPGFAYLEVAHDDDAFDIGVFLMPAGAAFPYHDHPGMTVFTRVLAGSVRIRNLDWVDGAPAVDANGRLTGRYVVQSDAIRDASLPTTVLTPSSGNVHGITAYAHSAILDVIVPPYDAERCCSYFADAGGMRLVEVDEPHGLDLACYDAMACF